ERRRGRGGGAPSRARRAHACRRASGEPSAASCGYGLARAARRGNHQTDERSWKGCPPPVPSRTGALEPEQTVGYAGIVAGFPVRPDLHNTTDRTQPQCHELGSKDYPVRVEHRREHRNRHYRGSCFAGPSASSSLSRIARILRPTMLCNSSSLLFAFRYSLARLSAAITATLSRPTTLPLSRISRILRLRSSADAISAACSSAGQATWYSFSRIRIVTRAMESLIT